MKREGAKGENICSHALINILQKVRVRWKLMLQASFCPSIVQSIRLFLADKKELPMSGGQGQQGERREQTAADHHLPARQCGLTWGGGLSDRMSARLVQ